VMDITNFNLRLASMVYCSFRITYLLARYLLFSSWQSDCRSSYCLAFILFQVCSSSLSCQCFLPLLPYSLA